MSTGCYYGPMETWKIVYYPRELNGGMMGVALVEADCHQQAMRNFSLQYSGQYSGIQSCTRLLG